MEINKDKYIKMINKERLLVSVYLLSIVSANILISYLGPEFSVLTSFLFIGFDLTSRDFLHEIWSKYRFPKMALLILSGSILSYMLNSEVFDIATASFVAFMFAGVTDYITYSVLTKFNVSKTLRMNLSNVFSSAVDSFVFPALAFGFPILWMIVLGQFFAKVGGGYLWVKIIDALSLSDN